jgi:hypothetical protein
VVKIAANRERVNLTKPDILVRARVFENHRQCRGEETLLNATRFGFGGAGRGRIRKKRRTKKRVFGSGKKGDRRSWQRMVIGVGGELVIVVFCASVGVTTGSGEPDDLELATTSENFSLPRVGGGLLRSPIKRRGGGKSRSCPR